MNNTNRAAPAAAPASTVSSSGKIDGPHRINNHEELSRMTSSEIVEAHRDGLLDELL
jgi:hypothetical protein